MKKFLLTCAALATLGAATSASAQPFRFDGDFGNFGAREARAERQIEWCQRLGNMSWQEARQLRFELRYLQREIYRARYDGLDRREFYALERRMDAIERQIRYECRDYNPRGPLF